MQNSKIDIKLTDEEWEIIEHNAFQVYCRLLVNNSISDFFKFISNGEIKTVINKKQPD
jgi:hypothetical protein